MHPVDVIKHMADSSGKTLSEVSKEINRARTFLHVSVKKRSVPRIDTFCKIAQATGYSVSVCRGDQCFGLTLDDEKESKG